MDALALLCNLHADGPFTLQRLRRSGCDSLAALTELSASELCDHLDGNLRTAERFLREAELLAERLEDETDWASTESFEEEVLEEEEEDYEEDELDDEEGYVAAFDLEPGEELEEEPLDPEEAGAPQAIGEVLDAWRQADHDAPPEDPVDYVVPRPSPPSVANRALDEIGLEGLGPELRERLQKLGILSLRGLIDATPLELARSLELPFTRVRHLQFLARRQWDARAPAQGERGETHTPPAPRSSGFLDRLDASGPFASEPGRVPD